jgi:hypothetical protein
MERQLEGMRQRLTERRRSEMNDPNELADRHVAFWNEPDPDRRRLPELRRAVHSSGRPAPDDGTRAAAGAADGVGLS